MKILGILLGLLISITVNVKSQTTLKLSQQIVLSQSEILEFNNEIIRLIDSTRTAKSIAYAKLRKAHMKRRYRIKPTIFKSEFSEYLYKTSKYHCIYLSYIHENAIYHEEIDTIDNFVNQYDVSDRFTCVTNLYCDRIAEVICGSFEKPANIKQDLLKHARTIYNALMSSKPHRNILIDKAFYKIAACIWYNEETEVSGTVITLLPRPVISKLISK
jgi:hypothetical protein